MEKLFKGTKTYYINLAVTVALMIIIGHLPALEGVTELGMGVLGIFVGALYGWVTVGIAPVCILAMAGLALYGYASFSEMLVSGLGSSSCVLVIAMFPLVGMLNRSGVVRWLAIKCFHSKLAQKAPYLFFLMLYLVEGIIMAITIAMPLIFLFWELFEQLFDLNGMKRDKTTKLLIIISAFAASAGNFMYLYNYASQATLGLFMNATGLSMPNAVSWFILCFVVFLAMLVVILLYARFIVKIQVPKLNVDELEDAGTLSGYQKAVGTVFIIFLAVMILISVLPASSGFVVTMNKLGAAGIALICTVVIVLLNYKDGCDFQACASTGAMWEIFFMILFIAILGGTFTSERTGINAWIFATISPIFDGMSDLTFMACSVIAATVLTNFLNNFVVCTFMIPLCCGIAASRGINPYAITAVIMIGTNCGLMLPSSSTYGAILASSDMVETKDCVIHGFAETVLSILVLIVIGIPLAQMLYPM